MGTLIPQTKHHVLPPGTYRVRLGAAAVEDGIYGPQVVMRFDVLDEEFAGRCVKAWAAAKLAGCRRPSKLYSWTSALLFGGMPLPDDYDLDTDALRSREAWALVEVIEREGAVYNRIVQLFPLRAIKGDSYPNLSIPAYRELAVAHCEVGCVNDSDNGRLFDEEPPW